MSRIHRIVEKAEREGLLTRTRAVAEPPPPPPPRPVPVDRLATDIDPVGLTFPRGGREAVVPHAPRSAPALDAPGPPVIEIDPLLVVTAEPSSPAAEQFRLLRTRLSARNDGRPLRVVLVTSPLNGDGKTVTSANLALSIAQEFQQRVVLVDADLRRPALGALFDLPAGPGLADVLIGTASLEEALVPVPAQHLTVLPAGGPPARPSELVGSTAMRRTLETLRSQFDRIVIDTPPVALADTHVLSSLADGVLMVVRAGVTPSPDVERALAAFDREKLLGLVLNGVEEAADDGYRHPKASVPVATTE